MVLLTNLKSLSLAYSGSPWAQQVLAATTKLQTLRISVRIVAEETAAITGLTNLTELFGYQDQFSEETFEKFTLLTNLTDLHLCRTLDQGGGTKRSPELMYRQVIGTMTNLKILSLSPQIGCLKTLFLEKLVLNINEKVLSRPDLENLTHMTTLQELKWGFINNSRVKSKVIPMNSHDFDCLRGLTNLKTLIFTSEYIGINDQIKKMTQLTQVTKLILPPRSDVSEEALKVLANSLTRLRVLHLGTKSMERATALELLSKLDFLHLAVTTVNYF
jgi:hypothetical protein